MKQILIPVLSANRMFFNTVNTVIIETLYCQLLYRPFKGSRLKPRPDKGARFRTNHGYTIFLSKAPKLLLIVWRELVTSEFSANTVSYVLLGKVPWLTFSPNPRTNKQLNRPRLANQRQSCLACA